ncbi:MAG: hypothetical protein J6386_14660 [Candidatus Synoicihabitans palmerolidicus]|nr:hypothetical protein [Candidatus Synoicihabitans palmerolidicus]
MSNRRKSHSRAAPAAPDQPELGLVSIPLLCCLLGAALFVYEYGGSKPTLTHEFLELEERVASSAYTAHTLDEREQTAVEKLRLLEAAARLARLQDELAALLRRHAQLEAQQQDLIALERLVAEIAATRLRIQDLQLQRDKVIAARRSVFAGYTGPYLLIECVAGEIIVHLEGQHLSLEQLAKGPASLLAAIDAVGYVAIAVRPGGWQNDSFEAAQKLIYGHIEAVRAGTGRQIFRTDFPLDTDEPIGPYLPPSV